MAAKVAAGAIGGKALLGLGGALIVGGGALAVFGGKKTATAQPPPTTTPCGLIDGMLVVSPPSPVYYYSGGELHPFSGSGTPAECGYKGTIQTIQQSQLNRCSVGSSITCNPPANPWPYTLTGCHAAASPSSGVIGSYIVLNGYASWSPTPSAAALSNKPYNWFVYREGDTSVNYYSSGFQSGVSAAWSSGNASPGTYIGVFGVRNPITNEVLCASQVTIVLYSPRY